MSHFQNEIANPFGKNDRVLVPAGTPIRTCLPGDRQRKVAGRNQTVTVHHLLDGHVDLWNHQGYGFGYVILPEITWPGTGGYWHTVKITPELAAANGVTLPPVPFVDPDWNTLDVIPAYGPGYDDRYSWTAEPALANA